MNRRAFLETLGSWILVIAFFVVFSFVFFHYRDRLLPSVYGLLGIGDKNENPTQPPPDKKEEPTITKDINKEKFNEFVSFYESCKSKQANSPCLCGYYDFSGFSEGVKLEILKQSGETQIQLRSQNIVSQSAIPRDAFCFYDPSQPSGMPLYPRDVPPGAFFVNDNSFAQYKKDTTIQLMKYDQLITCVVIQQVVSNIDQAKTELKKLSTC